MSLKVKSKDAAHSPALLQILNKTVVCDIPGKCHYCIHCKDVMHVLTTCHQDQCIHKAERQL